MPFDLSMGEILVVFFVALLVFGGKLPEMAKRLGLALSEFKRGMREEMRKVELGVRSDAPPPEFRPPPKPAPPEGAPAEPTRRDP